MFFPVTTLQNSIASGQEYYQEYEEDEYSNQGHDTYQNDEKNAPIVNIEKKLFVCNDVNNLPDNLTDIQSPLHVQTQRISSFLQHERAANMYHVTMNYVHQTI